MSPALTDPMPSSHRTCSCVAVFCVGRCAAPCMVCVLCRYLCNLFGIFLGFEAEVRINPWVIALTDVTCFSCKDTTHPVLRTPLYSARTPACIALCSPRLPAQCMAMWLCGCCRGCGQSACAVGGTPACNLFTVGCGRPIADMLAVACFSLSAPPCSVPSPLTHPSPAVLLLNPPGDIPALLRMSSGASSVALPSYWRSFQLYQVGAGGDENAAES